jgi:hypothetical protein
VWQIASHLFQFQLELIGLLVVPLELCRLQNFPFKRLCLMGNKLTSLPRELALLAPTLDVLDVRHVERLATAEI